MSSQRKHFEVVNFLNMQIGKLNAHGLETIPKTAVLYHCNYLIENLLLPVGDLDLSAVKPRFGTTQACADHYEIYDKFMLMRKAPPLSVAHIVS